MEAIVLLPGEGERIPAGASTAVMKATAATTGGAFSLSEGTFPAGMSGPPPHAHRHTTDTFYVLEGTLHLTVGGRELDAPAGSYVLAPPGVTHTFANTSDAPVRFLNINAPGGWERYLRELAAAMRAGALPGSAAFAQLVARYDFVVPA
ncbi:MAG TPA: cupin domain-containing protein [Thermomicrobiales bacterium]|nr:cupin domain-containing protein [Thermomicrobiales bacterium]